MAMLLAAGIGAAGSIGGALLSGGGGPTGPTRFEKREIERQRLETEKATKKAELGTQLATQQSQATESARLGLFSALGAEGTYDNQPSAFTGISPGGGGLFKDVTLKDKATGEYRLLASSEKVAAGGKKKKKQRLVDFGVEAKGKILDPEAFVKQATNTAQFRTMSRLTAEADQLIKREGPLWEEMNNSVLGGIYEGAAALHREQMKTISDAMARGGTARRQGLAAIQQMRAVENNNRQRQQSLWQGKLALDQWARNNARTQLAFNQAWVNNHEGVRDKFNTTMNNLAQFYGKTIMPSAINAASDNTSNALRAAGLAATRSKQQSGVGDIVSGLSTMLFSGGVKGLLSTPGAEAGGGGTSPGGVGAGGGVSLPGGGAVAIGGPF